MDAESPESEGKEAVFRRAVCGTGPLLGRRLRCKGLVLTAECVV